MEDTFRVRVDKIFGSLTPSTATPSPSLSSLWSLTDDEIEKREWNRDKESPEPEPNSFRRQKSIKDSKDDDHRFELEKDIEDLDDNDVGEDDDDQTVAGSSIRSSAKPDDYGDEEWEIKSSIGLDCTLDYEVIFFLLFL